MSKSSLSVGNQRWADRFNEAWNSSNEKILEACEILVKAQKELPKPDFADLIKNKVRCGESVARKLIIVGKDERLRALVHKLPVHWSTHYEFTKLSDDEFHEALARDDISKIRRDDVKKLRRPIVTDAEYHNVTQSPDPHPGVAVSAEGESSPLPQAPTVIATPPDDRQGGDSVVIPDDGLQGHYRDSVAAHEALAWADLSVAAQEALALADSSVAADDGERRRQDAARALWADEYPLHPPREGMVALWIDPHSPMSALALGLMLAMEGAATLAVAEAAVEWPENMPLRTDHLHDFADWLIDFEAAYRVQHGNGNAAALAADAAQ